MPGDLHGSTAQFRLTVSPTDERTDEMILPCSVADSELAHAVLHDLRTRTGDEAHRTVEGQGHRAEAGSGGVVRRLEILGARPLRPDEEPARWLAEILPAIRARFGRHPGNLRFCGQLARVAPWLATLPERRTLHR